jgi:hypothetical protein
VPEGPSPLPHINQSPMHLQSPRTLESVTVMHMCLMFNSFGASSSSDPDRSVKAEPIGKASNAKALINKSLCSHNLTKKSVRLSTLYDRQYCQPALASNCRVDPDTLACLCQLSREPSKQSVGSSPVRCRSER